MSKRSSTAFQYQPRKPWFKMTEAERLEEMIEVEKRQIDLLKNSSWMGDPPWIGRELSLSALEERLARIKRSESPAD